MSDGNQNSSIEKSGFYPVARPNTFGLTDVGRRREVNQDQFLIAQLNKSMLVTSTSLPLDEKARLFGRTYGQVLFVADGMGGHAAGEEASSLAINHLVTQLLNRVHWFFQDDRDDDELFVDGLRGLLRSAHRRILNASDHNSALRGMGTTMTMAYVVWPKLWVVHAGDSRCYLVRNGKADQLTTDHTLARRLVEQGGMPPEEEAKSRWSNVLWNVLGGSGEGGELLAEVQRGDLLPGDTIVLCSDGLYRYVTPEVLADVVESTSDLDACCQRLIEIANDAGGEDNITVVISRPVESSDDDLMETAHAEQSLESILAPEMLTSEMNSSSLDETWPG